VGRYAAGGVVGVWFAPGECGNGDVGCGGSVAGDKGACVKGCCEDGDVGETMECASDSSRDLTYECFRSALFASSSFSRSEL